MPHPRTTRAALVLSLLAGSCCALAAGAGQPPVIDPSAFNGRDFAGARLASAPQRGVVRLAAQRISTWTDDASGRTVAVNPAATPGTQRLYLRGDVSVTLAYAHMRAARAVVWVEPLEESRANPGHWVQQVAIYFDRLSDPAGDAGLAPSADRILVTAVVDGPLIVSADALAQGRPTDLLVVEGERRFARFLRDQSGPPDPEASPPDAPFAEPGGLGTMDGPILPGQSQPYEPGSPLALGRNLTPTPSLLDREATDTAAKLFSGRGIISFSAGEAVFVTGEHEDAAIVTGGVIVLYSDVRNNRTLQITAERAVVFLEKGAQGSLRELPAARVRGVYLEGDVVGTDGRATLRGPRIYYDVAGNRALALNAVFWTYDTRTGMPLYVRAAAIRQTAAQQVEAREVTLSASSFFEPQFSLAANRITVTRERSPDEIARTIIDGRSITPRIAGVPFFLWPRYRGDIEHFPLRDIAFESSSETGFGVKTRFDMLGILGIDKRGWRADLLLDGWVERGVGVGADLSWREPNSQGNLLAYMVPFDNGTDVLASGVKRERDDDFRGILMGEHRWDLSDNWTLFLEAAHVSDENFIPAYYKPLAENRREFTNAATIRFLGDQSIFYTQFMGSFNDFTPNEYLLQSLGYSVDRLPEAFYARVSDDLLAGTTPGLLTWSHEYRAGLLRLNFTEPTASELGYNTPALAGDAFGILPGQSIGDRLRAAGVPEEHVLRADTRQELALHLKFGNVNVTPFLVGRATAWDNDFSAFAPGEDDQIRLWGAAGARIDATYQRIFENVESALFDLHKLRHIVQPSATLWAAGTNREQSTLPIFDERVENIAEGTAGRVGVTQVFQTQRGGPGRWRNVDVLRISTDLVWSSNDAPRESSINRFFDYRPEYSQLGRFAQIDAAWQATDSLAFTFADVYSFDFDQQGRLSAGMLIRHSADFTTFAELHYINARNATYVDLGGNYRITPFYMLGVAMTYDTDASEIQGVAARITREFEAFDLGLRVGFNNITGETAFGVSFSPHGRDVRQNQLRRLGRDQLEANATGLPSDDIGPPALSSPPSGTGGFGGASGPGGPLQ